jgi:hypothetical protein
VWRLQLLVIAAIAGGIVVRCFPRPIDVPGRSGGVEWVVVPVVPAAIASLVPVLVRRVFLPLERISGRFDATGRLAIVAVVLGTCLTPVALGVGALRLVDVRNCGLAVGVALLSIYLVPAALGWAPIILLALVTWLIGVPAPGVAPPAWALLLAPASSRLSLVISGAILTAGTAVFVVGTQSSSEADAG